ncbi:MAG: hypothetical protein QMD50_00590 [Patescibacteria group bacterium]|nr:hypothetical protein [Patescibacteria group bacterium]
METKKRKFVGVGEIRIRNSNTPFELYRWAETEAQARFLFFNALKKQYPRLSFSRASLVSMNCPRYKYISYEVEDITSLSNDEVRKLVQELKKPIE